MNEENPPPSIQDPQRLANMYGQFLDELKRNHSANHYSRNAAQQVVGSAVPGRINDLMPPEGSNYITKLLMRGAAGKNIDLDETGNPTKTAQIAFVERWAKAVELDPNEPLKTVCPLLTSLGPNESLQLGFLASIDHKDAYWQFSKERMADYLQDVNVELPALGVWSIPGYAPVTQMKKENLVPGVIVLFDRDIKPNTPPEIAQLSFDDWWNTLVKVEPSLAKLQRVVIPSASARVVWPNGQPVFPSMSSHTYLAIKNPADLERVKYILEVRSVLKGVFYGDEKSHELLFDKGVFGDYSRPIFDNSPSLTQRAIGAGLRVLPPQPVLIQGSPYWDTSEVADISDEEKAEYFRITGKIIRKSGENSRHTRAQCLEEREHDLTLDTKISTKDHGEMSVRQFIESDLDSLTCHPTFRESQSGTSGLLAMTQSAGGFLYDHGSGIAHHLTVEDEVKARREKIYREIRKDLMPENFSDEQAQHAFIGVRDN